MPSAQAPRPATRGTARRYDSPVGLATLAWSLGIAVLAILTAAVAAVIFVPDFYGARLRQQNIQADGKSSDYVIAELVHENRTLIVQTIGGLGLLLGVLLGTLRFEAEQRTRREEQVAERFTRAVDQLGHGTMDVRIGGIFALEKIAQDYKDYHWTIMEILTTYVCARYRLPGRAAGRFGM